jgi:hypothetical protein
MGSFVSITAALIQSCKNTELSVYFKIATTLEQMGMPLNAPLQEPVSAKVNQVREVGARMHGPENAKQR